MRICISEHLVKCLKLKRSRALDIPYKVEFTKYKKQSNVILQMVVKNFYNDLDIEAKDFD